MDDEINMNKETDIIVIPQIDPKRKMRSECLNNVSMTFIRERQHIISLASRKHAYIIFTPVNPTFI